MVSTEILNPSMLGKKRDQVLRGRNMRKGYIYLGLAAFLLVAYSATFLVSQTKLYLNSDAEIVAIQSEIKDYKEVKIQTLEKELTLHQSASDEKAAQSVSALDKVLPTSIDKIGITRRLEDFAVQVAAKPPFELNSISFGEPEVKGEVTVLPISMSIYSSRTNFDLFLQLINLSGKLDSKTLIRLMEISNISIRYRGTDTRTGEDLGVDFSVQLKAYSRT
jgi:hypothetical protein